MVGVHDVLFGATAEFPRRQAIQQGQHNRPLTFSRLWHGLPACSYKLYSDFAQVWLASSEPSCHVRYRSLRRNAWLMSPGKTLGSWHKNRRDANRSDPTGLFVYSTLPAYIQILINCWEPFERILPWGCKTSRISYLKDQLGKRFGTLLDILSAL